MVKDPLLYRCEQIHSITYPSYSADTFIQAGGQSPPGAVWG